MYIACVHVHVKPENGDAFIEATLENARNTVREPGALRFDVIRQTLEEMGAQFKMIFGMPGEPGVAEQIMPFARAAQTVRALSRSRIGLLGYISMGMYTAGFDHIRLRAKVGPEVDS